MSFFSGDVCACQVIFKATGITSAMVPPEAVEKIDHLLVSTAENGVSTHERFLDTVKEFDEYLTSHTQLYCYQMDIVLD